LEEGGSQSRAQGLLKALHAPYAERICFPEFTAGGESRASYGPADSPTADGRRPDEQWHFSEAPPGYDGSMWGDIVSGGYPLGGFVVPTNVTSAAELKAELARLEASSWVDSQTRAVLLDVQVWNPTEQLVSVLKLQVEQTRATCHSAGSLAATSTRILHTRHGRMRG
jgi:hypothetical protein